MMSAWRRAPPSRPRHWNGDGRNVAPKEQNKHTMIRKVREFHLSLLNSFTKTKGCFFKRGPRGVGHGDGSRESVTLSTVGDWLHANTKSKELSLCETNDR